jgi:chorismate dehydratase
VSLRLAAIDFLNPAPLMYDFEHAPTQGALAEHYAITRMMPSACAAALASGDADLGLIPIAAYTPELAVVPGCAIASLDHIRSILLVSKCPVDQVRTVALDTASRTSVLYTQILFRTWWSAAATFLPHAPDLDAMLQVADAALVIGDPALYALEACDPDLLYYDLGHEWQRRTGVPWVSAFWAVRPSAIADPVSVIRDLSHSRDAGLAHIPELVREWAPRLRLPETTVHEYLTRNIYYYLDEACLEGIDLFYRHAFDCKLISAIPPLTIL